MKSTSAAHSFLYTVIQFLPAAVVAGLVTLSLFSKWHNYNASFFIGFIGAYLVGALISIFRRKVRK